MRKILLIPKYSIAKRIRQIDKVVENAKNADKNKLLQKLREKFKLDNLGLVDLIRYLGIANLKVVNHH